MSQPKDCSTPLAAELTDGDLIFIVERLGQGWTIRTHSHGWDNWMTLEHPESGKDVQTNNVHRLMDLGYVKSCPGGYEITDAGKRAYIKSTDEMGDGKLPERP